MMRILILLAIAATGVLTSVATAEAGVVTNTTVSYNYSGWVPCANGGTGELVNGTIDAHLLETSTTNANIDAWQFMFAPRGKLVGATSGDTYRLTGVEHGSYINSADGERSVLTYINRYKLIGAGQSSNLTVRETAHVTINGDAVVVDFDRYSIECS